MDVDQTHESVGGNERLASSKVKAGDDDVGELSGEDEESKNENKDDEVVLHVEDDTSVKDEPGVEVVSGEGVETTDQQQTHDPIFEEQNGDDQTGDASPAGREPTGLNLAQKFNQEYTQAHPPHQRNCKSSNEEYVISHTNNTHARPSMKRARQHLANI
ncbi:hypothetical protein FDENT_11407 [Fusarium denticulatum]|uniref:Uncharacterized protein n=1 Tax=Fusarium denticulatum TaxID=48507 RepID=A0A8H5TCW5_9HYPO|nr:hypothetical protein FDENT_11407 [Fusarium denticulatum]